MRLKLISYSDGWLGIKPKVMVIGGDIITCIGRFTGISRTYFFIHAKNKMQLGA